MAQSWLSALAKPDSASFHSSNKSTPITEPVRITSKAGNAVLMSADDYDSWQETVYLLRSPENARRLMESVARDKSSQIEHRLVYRTDENEVKILEARYHY